MLWTAVYCTTVITNVSVDLKNLMLGCYMAWFTHVHGIVALALFLTVEIQGKNIHVATESRHLTLSHVILFVLYML